jgi:hypothetical protein
MKKSCKNCEYWKSYKSNDNYATCYCDLKSTGMQEVYTTKNYYCIFWSNINKYKVYNKDILKLIKQFKKEY